VIGDPSLWIHTGESRGPILTSKSGQGICRQTFETVVLAEIAEALFLAIEKRIIEKMRWKWAMGARSIYGRPVASRF